MMYTNLSVPPNDKYHMPFLFIVVSKDCDIAQLDINTSASMIPNSIFIVLGTLAATIMLPSVKLRGRAISRAGVQGPSEAP